MSTEFRDVAELRTILPGGERFPGDGTATLRQAGKVGPWVWEYGDRSGYLATGSIQLLSKGVAGDSVNIDDYEITLTDGVAGPRQIKIAGGPTSTGDRLRDHINQAAGADANFPVTATNAAGVVTLTARKNGLSGNLIALSAAPKDQTSFRLSGPWLSGAPERTGRSPVVHPAGLRVARGRAKETAHGDHQRHERGRGAVRHPLRV